MLAAESEDGEHDLAAEAKAVAEKLKTLEAALVDVHRESDRDVLRNPAGLNDTLLGLISTVSLSDSAPTNQAAALSREIMARVDAEIGRLERLAATEVATVNRLALGQELREAVPGAKAYLTEALRGAYALGGGAGPVDHLHPLTRR